MGKGKRKASSTQVFGDVGIGGKRPRGTFIFLSKFSVTDEHLVVPMNLETSFKRSTPSISAENGCSISLKLAVITVDKTKCSPVIEWPDALDCELISAMISKAIYKQGKMKYVYKVCLHYSMLIFGTSHSRQYY